MVVQVGRGGVVDGGGGCGGVVLSPAGWLVCCSGWMRVVVDVEGVGLSLAGWLVAPVAAVETRRDHTAAQLRPPHNLCNTSSHYQLL